MAVVVVDDNGGVHSSSCGETRGWMGEDGGDGHVAAAGCGGDGDGVTSREGDTSKVGEHTCAGEAAVRGAAHSGVVAAAAAAVVAAGDDVAVAVGDGVAADAGWDGTASEEIG